ncbi:MAG: hypothetical protein LUH63_23070 [Parabacteroides sp.]|nr:hypothetical protein [Parabacteroides sp.]
MRLKIQIFLLFVFVAVCAYGQDTSFSAVPVDTNDMIEADSRLGSVDIGEGVGLLYQYPRFTINRTGEKRGKTAIPPYVLYSPYWKRHKLFKTLGWSALGLGLPAMVFGVIGGLGAFYNGKNEDTWYGIFYGGMGLTLASVPFFICSVHYKHRAYSLSIGGASMNSQPALAVRVSF